MPIGSDNLRALSDFAVLAEEYCRFIDRFREGRPAALYHDLEGLLCRLHSAILAVGTQTAAKVHPEFEKLRMTHEQWAGIRIADIVAPEIRDLVEWHNDMAAQGTDAERGAALAARVEMLWDDLADIYRDLHHGLSLWRLGEEDSRAQAAWEWRLHFEIHWGDHLLRAMATVHEARYLLCAD